MDIDRFLTTTNLLLLVIALGVIGYVIGRIRAVGASKGQPSSLHSRPGYHAAFVMIWTAVPALLVLVAWLIAQPFYVESKGYELFPDAVLESENPQLKMNTVMLIAEGYERVDAETRDRISRSVRDARSTLDDVGVPIPGVVGPYMVRAAKVIYDTRHELKNYMWIAVVAVALIGFAISLARVSRRLRARNSVERSVRVVLIFASGIAILTTFGIVFALIFDAANFFNVVPLEDFFFGTTWDQGFTGAGEDGGDVDTSGFGILPLLWGTIYISIIALLIAVPIGLFAAIYMAEFATERFRAFAKPVLEVLAGIPTIVYGFFALVTVGPVIHDFAQDVLGLEVQARNALTAGLVMGIMIIPFVSSLSDDIITAVPQSLRDASLGLGATKAETVKKVVLPASLPGIVAAVLLAASRAIGETMIVVLAAGATPGLSVNPLEAMTTVTVTIVNTLKADVDFTSPQALAAYALGITLFAITLIMNVYALRIVRKYREQYE